MEETILDEVWYNSCMNCKRFMKPKNPYDYWCSETCKEEGEVFIKRLAEDYAKALMGEF